MLSYFVLSCKRIFKNPCLVRGGCADDILGRMIRKDNFYAAGAIVLGMHDALVSLTGLIAGLAVAMADRRAIILTAIIASVTASLSMGASNYLAVRTDGGRAFISALYTGAAYMITCALLILPFFIFENRITEIAIMFLIAIAEIFMVNYYIGHMRRQPYIQNFLEMLGICTGVSIIAFLIGWCANAYLGISA